VKNAFVQTIGKVSVLIGKSCGPLYLTAIVLSLYEVFSRYVLNAPTVWTTELIMCCVGGAWMLSAPAVTQQNRHITVTVLEMFVGTKIWKQMSKLAIVVSIIAVMGLMWATFDPAVHAIETMERSGSAFNPPLPTLFKGMLVVTCFFYILQLLARLLDDEVNESMNEALMEELSHEVFGQDENKQSNGGKD